jgi:hypothetical protein
VLGEREGGVAGAKRGELVTNLAAPPDLIGLAFDIRA